MKHVAFLLSAVVLLATTMLVAREQSWTGRVELVGSRYYFFTETRFYPIANQGQHPDLLRNVGHHTVMVTGELTGNSLTVSKIEAVQPIDLLKRLFPIAVAFSPKGGTPAHYKAYAVDPRKNPSAQPLGFAFWTTDVVPLERGYEGPIVMLVGMDKAGILAGVVVDYNREPYGHLSVDTPGFAAQFKGKSIRDGFRVGADVDAISRASISVNSAARAIRDSSRLVARQFLTPEAVK